MSLLENIQKHNYEVGSVILTIKDCIQNEDVSKYSNILSSLIEDLTGKIHMAYSFEDKVSLLKILKNADEDTRDTIKAIINENKDLEKIFNIYLQNYKSSEKIKNNPEMFIKNSMDLYSDFKKRVQREKEILGPILNKLH